MLFDDPLFQQMRASATSILDQVGRSNASSNVAPSHLVRDLNDPDEWQRFQEEQDRRADYETRRMMIDDISGGNEFLGRTFGATVQTAAQIGSLATRPFNSELSHDIARLNTEVGQISEELYGGEGTVGDRLARGWQSLLPSVWQMGMLGPLGAKAVIPHMAVNKANLSYTEAIDAGLPESQAAKYAVFQGAIEGVVTGVFQKLAPGMEGWVLGQQAGKVVGREALKQFGVNFAGELAEEQLITFAESYTRAMMKVDPKAMDPDRLLDSALDTLAATVVGAGVIGGPTAYNQTRGRVEQEDAQAALPPPSSLNREPSGPRVDPLGGLTSTPSTIDTAVAEQRAGREQFTVGDPVRLFNGELGRVVEVRGETVTVEANGAKYGFGGAALGSVTRVAQPAAGEAAEPAGDVDLSFDPAEFDRPATSPPPPAPGMVRFYHGGTDQEGDGDRWFTPYLEYAEGYARKSPGGTVSYIDLPESSPLLRKAFDDTDTSTPAPYIAFEAPEQIARQRRPYVTSAAPSTPPDVVASVLNQQRTLQLDQATAAAVDERQSQLSDPRLQLERDLRRKFPHIIRQIHQGKDPASLPGFDLMRDEYARAIGRDPNTVDPEELMEIFRTRQRGTVAADDPAIQSRAEDMLGDQWTPEALAAAAAEPAAQARGFEQETAEPAEPADDSFSAAPRSSITPRISRRDIVRAFPGATVQERPAGPDQTAPGYIVEFPHGRHLEVRLVDQIPLDFAAIEKGLGKKLSAAERQELVAFGSFELASPDRKTGTAARPPVSGLGLIQLARDIATTRTIHHEALHFARQAGLFREVEWKALVGRYSDPSRPDAVQEEDIARGLSDKKQPLGLVRRMRDWFNRLLSRLGLKKLTPDAVESLMQSPAFYAREPKLRQETAERPDGRTFSTGGLGMGGRVVLGPGTKLYRETTIESADEFLPNSDMSGGWNLPPDLFFSDVPELALGQARNRGVLLEFDAAGLTAKEHTKPGTLFPGSGKEYVVRTRPSSLRPNLRAITVRPDATASQGTRIRVQRLLKQLEQAGWQKTENPDGSRTWTAPPLDMNVNQPGPSYETGPKPRPDLGNPATDPSAREFVDQVDTARTAAGRPEVRHDEDVQRQADEQLRSDYVGARQRILDTARRGSTLSDVETVAAKTILNKEVLDAIRSNDPRKIADAVRLVDAYRETGAEQARAFRQRRDPVETPQERRARLLGEALLTPNKKRQGRIDKARKDGNHERAEKELNEWGQELDSIRERLAEAGIDLNQIDEIAADPVKTAQTLREASIAKSDVWDAAYEYWRNSILSGPTTQMVNLVGNVGHSTWALTAERIVEATLNVGARQKDAASFGEFKHMLAGILPGITQGARNAFLSWKSEAPVFDTSTKLEDPRIHIAGRKGRVVRIPQRVLLFVDEFAKTLVGNIEVGAQAYRLAKAEGLSGQPLQDRIHELTIDPKSEAWERAKAEARTLAFQDDPGKLTQKFLAARKDVPGLRYLLPFVTTPANIFRVGARKSPLGSVPLAMKVYQAARTGNWSGVPRRTAEQLLAWGVVALLLGNDPEDPWITGTELQKSAGARQLSYRARPAQSINIGGRWYSYARVEPFATSLSATVDWINAFRSGHPGRPIAAPLTNLYRQMKDKTFLTGIGDLAKALEQARDNPEAGLSEWVADFGASWYPNLLRTTGRATQSTYPERAIWGEGPDWYQRLARRTLQRTEAGVLKDQPDVDLWGRTAPRTPFNRPAGNFVFQLLAPTRAQDDDVFIGDRVLMAWNNKHLDEEKFPVPPSPTYTAADGSRKSMTDEQYARFTQLAGEVSRRLVESHFGKFDPENPSESDIDQLTADLENGRRLAREHLAAEWAGGPAAALDAGPLSEKLLEKELVNAVNQLARNRPRWSRSRYGTKEKWEESIARFEEAQTKAHALIERRGDPQAALRAWHRSPDREGRTMLARYNLQPSSP